MLKQMMQSFVKWNDKSEAIKSSEVFFVTEKLLAMLPKPLQELIQGEVTDTQGQRKRLIDPIMRRD
jgi:hypothetical protein